MLNLITKIDMSNSTTLGCVALAITLLAGTPSNAAPPRPVSSATNPAAIQSYHIPSLSHKGDTRLGNNIATGSVTPIINREAGNPLLSRQRITPAGASIYGYFLPDDDEDSIPGFYEMNNDYGFDLLWEDFRGLYLYQWLTNGWIHDGKLCGYTYFLFPFYIEVDYLNGGNEEGNVIELDGASYFESCTFNNDAEKIYGFGHNENDVYGFGVAYPSDPGHIEIIRTISPDEVDDLWCSSLTYDSYTQTLYGINKKAQLVSIQPDGSQEVVYETGIPAQYYLTGLTFSPLERVFYWNVILADYSSVIYRIDTESKTSEIVTELPKYTQISFLACSDQLMSPQAPAPAMFETFSFPDGALSGSVSMKMPEKTYGDEPISTTLEYTLVIDREVYNTGSANGGESVTATIEDLTQGMHEFGVYVTCNGLDSKPVYQKLYVGNDTPLTPANVTLTADGKLIAAWDAVETGVNGGYINLSNMIYKVTLNTGEYQETTDTRCEFTIADLEQLQVYSVKVKAECNGMESEEGTSDYVVNGEYMTLPVSVQPTYEQSKLFSMPDEGWRYGEMPSMTDPDKTEGIFTCGYESDSWLIFPAIRFPDATRYYTFRADMSAISSNDDLDLEIYCGDSPDVEAVKDYLLTTVHLPKNDTFTEFVFKVPNEGDNCLAIRHVVKSDNPYGANVYNITIEDQGITGLSPASPTVSVTEVNEESKVASLRIKLPTLGVSGERLASDEPLTIHAECDGKETLTGKPGEIVELDVNLFNQEASRINVWAENAEGRGPSAYATAYMDMDVPWTVENLVATVSEDMLSMTLTWDAPSANASGGYCNPDNIIYEIMAPNDEGQYEVIANIGNATEYTYDYDGPQDNIGIAVLASNKYGDCNYAAVATAVLGEPYALPMDETFDDPGGLTTEPWNIVSYDEYTYTTNWRFVELRGLFPELAEPADYALTCTPGEYVEYDLTNIGLLSIPRFSTVGVTDAVFKATMATIGNTEFSLLGKTYGMDDYIEFGSVAANHELGEISIPLPEELQGRSWVELILKCHFAALDDMLVISDVSVSSPNSVRTLWDGDISISGKKGLIEIASEEEGVAEIYSVDGKIQGHHRISSGIVRIPAPKGVYIVKVGNRRSKVIVK